jgi:hypothetical protein
MMITHQEIFARFLVTFEIAALIGRQYFWAALMWLRIGSSDWLFE